MAASRTLLAYVLLLSIVLLSCSDLYKCKRDMSESHIEAAALQSSGANPRNLATVDGKKCAIRYIIGEPMYCCTNGCWDKLADCLKACIP